MEPPLIPPPLRRVPPGPSSTDGWAHLAACRGDDRYIDRGLTDTDIQSMIDLCHTCPVMVRCRQWAEAQTQPVGFAVAGGVRWKAWNHCRICGRKIRGVDLCRDHSVVGEPVGTIDSDGSGREYRVADEH